MVVFGLFVVALVVVLELLNVVTSSVVSVYEVTWPAVVVFVLIMGVLGVVVISIQGLGTSHDPLIHVILLLLVADTSPFWQIKPHSSSFWNVHALKNLTLSISLGQ